MNGPIDVPVLVVGGGPVGLAASIALSRGGVPSLLVERHPGTALHPKARGVDVRTMEVFRQWGIEDLVLAAGLPAEEHGFFYRGPTLTSSEFERWGGGGRAGDAKRLSPSAWLVIGQDALEPVLLAAVQKARGSEVRFGHELETFDQDDDGVSATVLDRSSGKGQLIRALFLVGADGSGSRTRETLGVELEGHGPLVHNVSILFRADLGPHTHDRQSAVYYLAGPEDARPRGYPMSVGNPPPNGVMLTINNTDRWLLVVGLPSPDSIMPDGEAATVLVRRAVGLPELEVDVLGVLPWAPAARVASRYRSGRAFLCGDAAHEMTPSGAFGLNVGIQDSHNLGWKLAATIRGRAGPPLLDTYEAERRPVGQFAAEQSFLQFSGAHPPRPFGNWGVILGRTYTSAAVQPDRSLPPDVDDPAVDYVPVARPGHRLPHAALGAGQGHSSTIDLVGDGFVVLSRDPAWAAAAESVAAAHSLPLSAKALVADLAPVDPEAFDEQFGIGERGAVLVRPDGYVAWRTDAAADAGRLDAALTAILGLAETTDRAAVAPRSGM